MSDEEAARKLWAAVLLQAVKDLHGVIQIQTDRRYREAHKSLMRDQTLAWFMDQDPHSAFCTICMVLGLEPQATRRRLVTARVSDLHTRAGLVRRRFYSMGLVR